MMDLDIEMEEAVDLGPVHDEPEPVEDIPEMDDQEPGEIEEPVNGQAEDMSSEDKLLVPTKVHVRGLDSFNPEDVKGYVSENYGMGRFRVEWVDDTAANLVFDAESSAQEAIVALAAVEIADATQLPPLEAIPAKSYSKKPDTALQIRFAVAGDRKVRGAATRSRFYLLNPEFDPAERPRKYRERDDSYRNGRNRRERRYEEEEEPFDVSLYDDDEASLAKRASRRPPPRRRGSGSSGSESDRLRSYAARNREKELFPDRHGRARDDGLAGRTRSLSPGRAPRDRDAGRDSRMDVDDDRDYGARRRNKERAQELKERISKDNTAKELFPSKLGSAAEGKAQMDQVDNGTILASAKLEDRVTSRPGDTTEFSIRGLAAKRGPEQGLAIKGTGTNVKELFPDKFNNSGKELFADKLEGRGRRRQRAEDLFY